MNCFVREGRGAAREVEMENHILAWQLNPVYPILTKIGMDLVLDPKNKSAEDFFFSEFKVAAFG